MYKRAPWLLAVCCALIGINAHAFTPVQHETIIRLGELNGVALQCGYTADTRRMKKALIDAVPKVAQLGDLFEDATQKGFLNMVQKNLPCPNLAPFRTEVDGAITALHRAFAEAKP